DAPRLSGPRTTSMFPWLLRQLRYLLLCCRLQGAGSARAPFAHEREKLGLPLGSAAGKLREPWCETKRNSGRRKRLQKLHQLIEQLRATIDEGAHERQGRVRRGVRGLALTRSTSECFKDGRSIGGAKGRRTSQC